MPYRILFLWALAIIISLPTFSSAETFDLPPLPEHEVKESRVYLQGKAFNPKTVSISQRLQYLESPKYLKATIQWIGQGAGRRLKFTMVETLNNKNTATNIFTFRPNSMVLDKYEKVIVNSSGRRIRREFYNLAHPYTGYPDDLMHPYTLEVAFRGLKFDKPGSRHSFTLWIPPNLIVPVTARVKGVETITLDSGPRKCYCVEMFPELASFVGPIVSRIIQPLIPDYSFWFDVNGTHPIVRYRGPLGKLNTIGVPFEVYDMVKIDPDPAQQ